MLCLYLLEKNVISPFLVISPCHNNHPVVGIRLKINFSTSKLYLPFSPTSLPPSIQCGLHNTVSQPDDEVIKLYNKQVSLFRPIRLFVVCRLSSKGKLFLFLFLAIRYVFPILLQHGAANRYHQFIHARTHHIVTSSNPGRETPSG